MAFCRPNWLNTCARTATSPSHEGVEGTAVGAIWIWIEGCVILFLCLLSREKDVILIFPLLRRHNFGLSCQFPDDLPPTNPGYAISLRMSWVSSSTRTCSALCWRCPIMPSAATQRSACGLGRSLPLEMPMAVLTTTLLTTAWVGQRSTRCSTTDPTRTSSTRLILLRIGHSLRIVLRRRWGHLATALTRRMRSRIYCFPTS